MRLSAVKIQLQCLPMTRHTDMLVMLIHHRTEAMLYAATARPDVHLIAAPVDTMVSTVLQHVATVTAKGVKMRRHA